MSQPSGSGLGQRKISNWLSRHDHDEDVECASEEGRSSSGGGEEGRVSGASAGGQKENGFLKDATDSDDCEVGSLNE